MTFLFEDEHGSKWYEDDDGNLTVVLRPKIDFINVRFSLDLETGEVLRQDPNHLIDNVEPPMLDK